MASQKQLLALHSRMIELQGSLIGQAAAAGTLLPKHALSQQAMLAVETMIGEQTPQVVERGSSDVLDAAE